MHPASMGMAFKFVGFEKNIPAGAPPLTGFNRCSDGRNALGLGEQVVPSDPYAAS